MALRTWNQCASKRIPRLSVFILAGWLSCCVRGSSGQLSIIPDVPVARVGQTVTLSLYINHTLNALTAAWYKGLDMSQANRILRYVFTANATTTGPWYSGKETALPDGSLRITDVWSNHTGSYTVEIQFTDLATFREASVGIDVYDVLTPPTLVNVSGSGFSGDDFKLDCQAGNQMVERYAFFKDTMNVTCDQQRIRCSENNSVLSFQPTKESDSGNYTCTIHNPVSHNSSLPLVVRVKAAPISNVTITSNMSSERLWENEDSVQLNCTAQGTDPVFSWMFNRSALPPDSRYTLSASNSSLTISPVSREDTGPFHCIASNSANEASVQLNLSISWRPNGSMICGATNISEDIQFSCSWHGGNPAASVQMVLPPIVNQSSDSEVSHSMSRHNITTNMTLSCNGIQENRTSLCSMTLGLPHDPDFETTNSSRPTEGEPQSLIVNLGHSSSSRVSSAQILPATFAWSRGSSSIPDSNDKLMIVSNTTSSSLTIYKVTVNDSGDYHCLVQNLMGSTTFSFHVNVQPAPESTTSTTTTAIESNNSPGSGGLSAGAIAGIVIGAVALAVIIGVTVFCVLKNKKGKNYGSNSSSEGTGSNQAYSMRTYC